MTYIKQIFFLLGRNKKKIPIMVLLFFFVSIFEVLSLGIIYPYLNIIIDYDKFHANYNYIIDPFDLSKDKILIIISICILAAFIAKALLSVFIKRKIFNFSQEAVRDLRIRLLTNFQSFSYAKYLNKNTSEYIYSLDTLTAAFQSTLRIILTVFSEVLVLISIAIFLGVYNISMLIFSLLSIGFFYVIFDFIFSKKLILYGKEDNIYSMALVKTVIDSVNGFKIIKLLKLNSFFLERLKFNQNKFHTVRLKLETIKILPKHSIETIVIFIVVSSALYFTVILKISSLEYLSIIALYGVAAIRIIPSSSIIISSLANLRRFRNSISLLHNDSILNFNDYNHNQKFGIELKYSLKSFKKLNINKMSFKYGTEDNYVLRNINFKINSGEKIGIIGKSGVGKSTFIDLILGMLKPTEGKILINGEKLEDIVEEWHSMVSFIPQDIYLIDDTLKKNIALGQLDKNINHKKVDEAIKFANLNKLVEDRFENINMLIGDRGLKISGGQKQRIALARLFYFNSDFIILDEATSALDEQTEINIYEKLYNLTLGKTALIISHNINNLSKCDRIYRITNGSLEQYNNDYKS